jgi:two-component system, NtrC family, response regulator AtoC
LNMKRLLIIDDEENMRHMLAAMLARHGYTISSARDGVEATGLVQSTTFDFILCDIRMPTMSGLEFLKENSDVLGDSTVIMMSAYGSVDLALEAMKTGAYDFISKPFKTDEVLLTLKKAEEREQLKRENLYLKKELSQRGDGFSSIIGSSKAITTILDLAEKVAPYSTTVLITGESGTGKELIARGIHRSSPRGGAPFFAINCGSIPADLLESELFGYLKGSFTGADKNKKGLFEEAHKSTLFLDEIGELPMAMQVKLLRVLQENEIRPIGASAVTEVDVRIIAATAKDLHREVSSGHFREDLYYRLNVLAIPLPPLRDRLEDIPALCGYFIKKYNAELDCAVKCVTPDAMKYLLNYHWPGNIRELENVIQRGLVLTDGNTLDVAQVPQAIVAGNATAKTEEFSCEGFSVKEAQKRLEAAMIKKALEETGGNKSKASVLLEMSYPSLLSKIKEYSI